MTSTSTIISRPVHRRSAFQNGAEEPEIRQEIKHIRLETLESTRRMVDLFECCKDAGVGTLASLQHQTEQLNNVEHALDGIHRKLKSSERRLIRIENSEKSICLSCACCVACSKKHQEKNPKLWHSRHKNSKGKGVSWNLSNTETGNRPSRPSSNESLNNNTADVYSRESSKLMKGMNKLKAVSRFQSIRKSSSQVHEQEIQGNLNDALRMVKDLKQIADEMGDELEQNDEELDRLNLKAASNVRRLTLANEKSGTILKMGSSPTLFSKYCLRI